MRFQIFIEGTVRPDPKMKDATASLTEMRSAVESSFKPDLQWGVDYTIFDIQLIEKEDNSDNPDN